MSRAFDPGYVTEPYLTLCAEYPGAAAQIASQPNVPAPIRSGLTQLY